MNECACGRSLAGMRRDAVACSAKCRKAAMRRRRGAEPLAYDVLSLRYGRRVGVHKVRVPGDRMCPGCGAPTAWGTCVICTPVLFRMATAYNRNLAV